MTRRESLRRAGLGLFSSLGLYASDPQNLSYPLRLLDSTLTAPNLLFVRDHFSEPAVSLDNWRLRIDGRVERPLELDFAELVELPSQKTEAFLECAGNTPNGSAISNGVWEGVPFSSLLASARPASDAAFVLLEGADSGQLLEHGPALPYSQVVPFARFTGPSSMVAYKYNDLALPKRNGFPARALFPGCYGMNSVKWLRRIAVLRAGEETNFERSGMNRLYNRVTRRGEAEQITRVLSVQVKSGIAFPTDAAKLPAGRYQIWGFAWSGLGAVRKVSVSVDGGKEWNSATLKPQSNASSWARWTYDWHVRSGNYAVMSRAEDEAGNQQPMLRDPARKDAYELNWCAPVHCSVR